MKDLITFRIKRRKQAYITYMLIFLLCLPAGILAQLNGTYTIGSGGDYSTLTAAAAALNANGVNGPVTFDILPGTYTEQVTFDYIPNSNENNPVVFQSQTGDSSDVVIQYGDATFSDNFVVKLKRLVSVTFKDLTFKTTNDVYCIVVAIEDYGTNLSFLNCAFEGNYSNQNNRFTLLNASGSSFNGLHIENCLFSHAGDGIKLNCSGKSNLHPRILNNRFDSVGYNPVLLYTSYNAVISDNLINGGTNGMDLSTLTGNNVITNNRIINISGTGIKIHSMQSSAGFESVISNNEVSANMNGKEGITINYSTYFGLYNNSVFVNRDYPTTKALSITRCPGSTVEVINNNLVSDKAGYAIYTDNTGDLKSCDHNNYYSPGRILAFWDPGTAGTGEDCEDLRTLKLKSNDNVHSIFAYPAFVCDTVLIPQSAWLDNTGKQVSDVVDDIDGNTRGNPPDIGCYEFSASGDVKPPLSGTITIGSGTYPTLQDAVNDARIKGVSDSLKIQFPSGTYNMQSIIPPITGASSKHPVIIESASGNAEDVTIQYDAEGFADNYLIILNGSSFLQFRNLSFNAVDERFCSLFRMKGMLDSLKFNNCIFNGKPISQAGTDIFEADDDINFHYQEYSGNTFNFGGTALNIYLLTNTSSPGKLRIENNTFRKSIVDAVSLSEINIAIISNNNVDSAGRGFYLRKIQKELLVNNNDIKVEYGYGISVNESYFSSSGPGRIYNNFISVYSGHPNRHGINLRVCDTIQIYYNSVYFKQNALSYHIYSPLRIYRGNSVDMRNNILFNKGMRYALYVEGSTFSESDYNCYYTEGENLAYWDQDCNDLDALRTVSGTNNNSVFANPVFNSPVDLHAHSAQIDSAGIPISGITEDIDGDLRDPQFPDIGADEFGNTFINNPPEAVNDTANVVQGQSITLDLLINDIDNDGDSIFIDSLSTALYGTDSLALHRYLIYTADNSFSGTDSLKYYLKDIHGGADSAWVIIHVLPGVHSPVAVNDVAEVIQGDLVSIYVLENDTFYEQDPIVIKSLSKPVLGYNHANISDDSTYVVYKAYDMIIAGVDSLQYVIESKSGLTDTAMIFITVKKPVAFEQTDIELEQVSQGAGNWIDYDMDGDMDIVVGGITSDNVYETRLYQNTNGSFTSSTVITNLRPAQFDAMAWGDFDNDGDADVIISGYERGNIIQITGTRLLKAEQGQFEEIVSDINNNNAGSVDWGDYDNDGDIDLLTGGDESKIYRNDGRGDEGQWIFTDVKTLTVVHEGSAKWGDYDKDGDLDILLSSTLNTNEYKKIRLYRNDGDGEFTEINTGIVQVSGRCIWCDYNNDGYPDIIFEGRRNDTIVSVIYRNDPDNSGRKFTDIHAGLTGLEAGSISYCDYDVDGDADILITGRSADNEPVTKLYENKGNDQFEEANMDFPGLVSGSASWVDYDNNDKPDILLTGYQNDHPFTAVFKGNAAGNNTPPETPEKLSDLIDENNVILSWNAANDLETPSEGLTYNLRVGTTSGGSEIMSAMAKVSDGSSFVPQTGNVGSNTSWALNSLPPNTTCYWSVQAVDPAYGTSEFSAEQTFLKKVVFSEDPSFEVPVLINGDMEWGDYDNDDDLDLIITGKTKDGVIITLIYKNIEGRFTYVYTSLPGFWRNSLDWGDYDNDGDLDLAISGWTSDDSLSSVTKIFRNDRNGVFTDIKTNITPLYDGDIAWGDYDNDGDLDLLITGEFQEQISATEIFRNDDGEFHLDVTKPGISRSSVAWCDFDNDRDQDFIVCGMRQDGIPVTIVYRNDGGIFTELTDLNLPGVYDGQVLWLDYNNDNKMDILITGNTGDEGPFTGIFRNDGNSNFNMASMPFKPVINSKAAWGDLDLDGKPDLVIGSPESVNVYLNSSSNSYSKKYTLPGIKTGTLALGDYNKDNKPDLILTGVDEEEINYCNLYNNISLATNHAPETPDGLRAYKDNSEIVFEWNKAGDQETSNDGLSYNLRIGTTPGNSDILSPMAGTSGIRMISRPGNTDQTCSWKISGLEDNTTYYWSVQSVDPSFAASAFAPEQTFSNSTTATVDVTIYDMFETPITLGALIVYYRGEDNILAFQDTSILFIETNHKSINLRKGIITFLFMTNRELFPGRKLTYLGNVLTLNEASWIDLNEEDPAYVTIHVRNELHQVGTNLIRGVLRISGSSGSVLKSSDETPDNYWVYLIDENNDIVNSDLTADDGSFVFDSVAQGRYTLIADVDMVPMDAGNDSIIISGDNEEYNIEAVSDGNSIKVTFNGTTRVNDIPDNDRITTYPNPVKDNLYLKLNDTNSSRIIITIISADGALIKEMSTAGNELLTIPLSDLSKGIYILKVKSEDMVYQTKFIKQ